MTEATSTLTRAVIDCAGEAVFQLVMTAGVLARLRHLHHSRLGQ